MSNGSPAPAPVTSNLPSRGPDDPHDSPPDPSGEGPPASGDRPDRANDSASTPEDSREGEPPEFDPGAKTEFILSRARSGNQLAWRTLYERYRRMLLVTIEYRMQGFLRRRFDAEDVLQEAFYKAWDRIETFEYAGEGSFRSWLRTIVFAEFNNLIKAQDAERRRVSKEASGETKLLREPSQDQRPSEIISHIEAKRHILEKMRQLDEDDREVITMRIFESMSWARIGEILGCSRELASKRFDRAIARLTRRA